MLRRLLPVRVQCLQFVDEHVVNWHLSNESAPTELKLVALHCNRLRWEMREAEIKSNETSFFFYPISTKSNTRRFYYNVKHQIHCVDIRIIESKSKRKRNFIWNVEWWQFINIWCSMRLWLGVLLLWLSLATFTESVAEATTHYLQITATACASGLAAFSLLRPVVCELRTKEME